MDLLIEFEFEFLWWGLFQRRGGYTAGLYRGVRLGWGK